MDQTNRALVVGAALVWIFLILVVILLAWGASDDSIKRLADLAGYMNDHNNTSAKMIVTFGGLILVLLGAIVIVLEVAPPETAGLSVATLGSGEGTIGTDEVIFQLERQISAMPTVHEARVTILARGRKAEVSMDLHVTAEADLASATEDACRLARELLEGRMGVALMRPPRAQLHYRELKVARPAGAAPGIDVKRPARPTASNPTSATTASTAPANPPASSMEPKHEPRAGTDDKPTGA